MEHSSDKYWHQNYIKNSYHSITAQLKHEQKIQTKTRDVDNK